MTNTLSPLTAPPTTDTTRFIDDIPHSLARSAHDGTSFVPERRAEQERNDYAQTLASDYAELLKLATTAELQEVLETEFARYREGAKRHACKYLQSRSRIVSTMIAGPANFPARQMNKRAEVSHKRLGELLSYRERALASIRRKLQPHLRPIMTGDADAADRLRDKIAKAQAAQQQMKAANSAIKRNAGESRCDTTLVQH